MELSFQVICDLGETTNVKSVDRMCVVIFVFGEHSVEKSKVARNWPHSKVEVFIVVVLAGNELELAAAMQVELGAAKVWQHCDSLRQ